MRTYTRALVQIAVLGLVTGSAMTAAAADYGAPETVRRGDRVELPAPADSDTPAPSPPASSGPVDTPPRGMIMDRVIAVYGAPLRRQPPVGQPPITRWDYPDYHLYFEYDQVLHAVVPGHPVSVSHARQLDATTR